MTVQCTCSFVTFEDDSAVDRVFAAGLMHEISGKKVCWCQMCATAVSYKGKLHSEAPERGCQLPCMHAAAEQMQCADRHCRRPVCSQAWPALASDADKQGH